LFEVAEWGGSAESSFIVSHLDKIDTLFLFNSLLVWRFCKSHRLIYNNVSELKIKMNPKMGKNCNIDKKNGKSEKMKQKNYGQLIECTVLYSR
jgi:hypothetical protein